MSKASVGSSFPRQIRDLECLYTSKSLDMTERTALWKALDFTISITVILSGAAAVYVAAAHYLGSAPNVAPNSAEYQAADRFAEIPGLDFSAASSTLVVAVRSTCRFCTESMEFYRRLISLSPRARIVFLGTEPQEALNQYVKEHQIAPDVVVSVKRGSTNLPRTPVVVHVGSDSIIRAVWVGKLPEQGEKEVIAAAFAGVLR